MPHVPSRRCPTANDPTAALLARALERALQVALVAAAAGCEADWPQRGEGFASVACDPLADLLPALPADFIALREFSRELSIPVQEIATTGTPCATASDKPACERALGATDGLVVNNVGIDHSVVRYVTMTRGDVVERYDSPDALRALLGVVDRPNEAVLMVRIAGYGLDCKEFATSAVRKAADGFEVVAAKMTKSCDPIEISKFRLSVASDGAMEVLDREVVERESSCVGRKPPGLVSAPPSLADSKVGRFFAAAARLEAASIHAFRILAGELTALYAPPSLVHAARAAARDEIRHARMMTMLARRFGSEPGPVRVTRQPPRASFALALDNAIEGCVRETFGALFGAYQAEHAEDNEVRRLMRVVARDELRHACLAWRIAAWLEPQLSAREQDQIARAQRAAVAGLAAEIASEPASPLLASIAGVPSRAMGAQLLAALDGELWAHRAA